MNIKNFEQEIDPVILDRGADYFEDDSVENLRKVSKSKWRANVIGTDFYDVEIDIKKEDVVGWYCDCPYDWGPVCKHVVAVLCHIRKIIEEGTEKDYKEIKTLQEKKTISRYDQFERILRKVTKNDLIDFVEKMALKDEQLLNEILVHFSHLIEEHDKSYYKQLIKSIANTHSDRYGFIDYNHAFYAMLPIENLIDKGQKLFEQENTKESIAICQAVIEEIPVMVQSMDDSAGATSMTMDQVFDILRDIAVQSDSDEIKNELFDYCLNEFNKSKYTDFGWESSFLSLLSFLITDQEHEQRFLTMIDNQIKACKIGDRYYELESLLDHKLSYFQNSEKYEQARRLIEENLAYPKYRSILVCELIEKKDFDQAKKMINEGIKLAEKDSHLGVVVKWKERLLEVAELEKDVENIRKLAHELFFQNHFDFGYYERLKKTYKNKNEWKAVVEGLIEKVNTKEIRYYNPSVLGKLFVKENYHKRLLNYLKENKEYLPVVGEFYSHLTKKYPKEIIKIYRDALYIHAEQTGRKIYNEIVRHMRKMKKIEGGEKVVKEMVQHFREKYMNRPAMMEILNRNFRNI